MARAESILITGGSGFIGLRLTERMDAEGFKVHTPGRAELDLHTAENVKAIIEGYAPGTIVHLAATPPAHFDSSYACVSAELAMLSNILAAKSHDTKLILAGSMAEIGFSGLHDEAVICRPNTGYGLAKHLGTSAALARRVILGDNIVVARLFGVYGPGEKPGRLIPHLIGSLRRGVPVPLSDGHQIRDFVHVDDVCDVLIALTRRDNLPGMVNVGTGQGVRVRDLCQTIAGWIGADQSLLEFGAIKRRAVDEDELVADTSLLKATLGHVPPQRVNTDRSILQEYLRGAETLAR